MGVYLSEINMPKGEGNKLVLQIFPNGEVYDEHGIRLGITNWEEAVPVPEHGDLIDRDWLKNNFHGVLPLHFYVENAPTVIPAEEEFNG